MTKKRSLTNAILLGLEVAVDGYVLFEDFAKNSHIYARGYERKLKKNNLSQSLRRLRLKGYIDLNSFNNKLIIKLTEKGKSQLLLQKSLNPEAVWDGRWRVVIFDIPEESRKVRNVLRSRLKLWQFKQLQKSVWVSKSNITDAFKIFVTDLGIQKWVLIFETENVSW